MFAGIHSWSPDRRSVVYAVCAGETIPFCEPMPEPTRVRPAAYGHYVYDLDTGVSRLLDDADPSDRLRVRHLAWLADGSYLFAAEEPVPGPLPPPSGSLHSAFSGDSSRSKLWWWGADGAVKQVLSSPAWFGQPHMTPDRRRVAFTAGTADRAGSTHRIWTFELASGEAAPASPVGSWARYQSPRWSPSGSRLGYYSGDPGSGRLRSELVVDAKVVHAEDGPAAFVFQWISDRAILIQRPDELLLLEVDSGRVLARRCGEWP